MANALYPKFKQALLDASANTDLNDGTVKAVLVDTGSYTYSSTHEFLTSLTGTVGTAQTIANTTVTDGLFDGDNVTFPSVSGPSVEAIVLYVDTGNPATSRLVAYLDTGVGGLPVSPSGGDIIVTWHVSGIFLL